MSYANKVKQQKKQNKEVEGRRRAAAPIASANGEADALMRRSERKLLSVRIPYTAYRDQGKCSVCEQTLRPASNYGVIPHTPKTCPGPGARTMMGGQK